MALTSGHNASPIKISEKTVPTLNEPATLVDNPGGIPLTPEGHAMLQQELDHLTSVKRPEIAVRLLGFHGSVRRADSRNAPRTRLTGHLKFD